VVLQNAVAATVAINKSKNREDLFAAVDKICRGLGFDVFLLSCNKPSRLALVLDSTFTTISTSFLQDYERLDWSDSDLNINRATSTSAGFFWDSALDRDDDQRIQSFIDYLYANDLSTGLMIPLTSRAGNFSVFSLISHANQEFGQCTVHAAQIIGNAAMSKMELLGLTDGISSDEAHAVRSLNHLQIEILNWIAEGKSNQQIGTIMNLNERMVRYHVSEIYRKLGIVSRAQAAVISRTSRFHPAV